MSKFGVASNAEVCTSTSNNGGSGDTPSNPHMPITSHKLNGHNYLPCSQSVMLFIRGKGKADFITGDVETPDKKDKAYKTWETENSKLMFWLINSMNTEVGENFLLYKTAKEMWDAAKDTYSNTDNVS